MQPLGCSFGARTVLGKTILREDPHGCVDQFPPTAVQFVLLQRCPKVPKQVEGIKIAEEGRDAVTANRTNSINYQEVVT